MCENKDRPDLELERLVIGDEVRMDRPSAGWLVREDVVRGAVERIKSAQDRTRQHGEDLQLAIARQNAALSERNDARGQVEKLQGELAEAKRVAEAATEVYLKKFDADTATMELKSEAFKNLAEMAYSYAEACGMKNYVEATVKVGPLQAKDGEELFFVTLQRMDGKTPHELKVEAEQERDDLRDQVEVLTAQLAEEERMVKRLREAVLGAPKGVVLGDVSRGQRYLGTWQGPNLPEDWTVGTKVALVRLTPDGLGLAGTTKHTEHTEEGVKA